MGKVAYRSDQYFNNKSRLDGMFGDAVIPVDLNAGLVSPKTDKYGMNKEAGEETEDNIQERFGLEIPNDNESY